MANLPDKIIKYEVGGEEVTLSPDIVRSFIVKGNNNLTDQEIVSFLKLCQYQKLNPFLNEAYIIKYGKDAQIVVGKETFLKRAEGHPQFDGYQAGVILLDKDNQLVERDGAFTLPHEHIVGGWAKIYRKDHHTPLKHTVSFSEYDKGQSSWKKMPATMIRKVALVQALREQFPESLGGMYTEEESQSFIQGDRRFEEVQESKASKDLLEGFQKERQAEKSEDEDEKVADEPKETIDWEVYTVDQIKKSLDNHGIDYPPKAPKSELVRIAQDVLSAGDQGD